MGLEHARPRGPLTASPTRCPYCHDACAPEADVRVCAGCLARHHAACWGEGQACASCGATDALARATGEQAADRASAADPAAASASQPGLLRRHARTLLAWEGLRVVFNVTLVLVAVAMLGPKILRPSYFLDGLVAALLANACFTLGPAAEVYLSELGVRSRWIRALLFSGGLLLSILVTMLATFL